MVRCEPQGHNVAVHWVINGEYVDLLTLQLDLRPANKDRPWSAAAVKPSAQGTAYLAREEAGPLEVRLRVHDLAGNVGWANAIVRDE
jgi:hypothetical protein